MKTTYRKWQWLVIGIMTISLATRATNPCIEGGPYTNYLTCLNQGTLVTNYALSPTNISVGVGQVIVPPTVSGLRMTNGLEKYYVSYDCSPALNSWKTNSPAYTFGNLYFVPAFPQLIWTPGAYSYTANIIAYGSPCSPLTNTLGIVTVNVASNTPDVLIDVDFGTGTVSAKSGYAAIGDSNGDFWNKYAITNQYSGSLAGLKTAEGYVSPVGLLVTNLPTFGTNGSPDPMYNGYLSTNGATATLTFTNLPAGTWNVYLYASDGNFTLSTGSSNYNAQTCYDQPLSTLLWQQGVQYVAFQNVVLTNGQPLTVTVNPGTNGKAMISGLQLASSYHVPPAISSASSVVAWGYNGYGQTNVPAGLSNVAAIGAGYEHSLTLKSDGTVVAWGDNSYGQTNVPAGLANVVAIAAGLLHNLALKSDGTVVAWGLNNLGQTTVPSGLTNVVAIAGGYYHSLALKSDGTVAAWGWNNLGQTTVPAGLTNVVAIATGGYYNLALKNDGTVVAWGWNAYGQTNVPVGLSNVVAITAGYYHSLTLKSDGTVVVWGDNSYGQTNVPAGLANVLAIAAGYEHSLALKSDGTVVAWGWNAYGQTNVPVGLSNVVAITAGYAHNLVLQNSAIPSGEIPYLYRAGAPGSLNVTLDSDYDGVSDLQELAYRTNPNDPNSVPHIRLAYFPFDNTNTWAGSAGQLPLMATNTVGVPSWDTNAVLIDSTNAAILKYRDVETNGNANINLRNGTIRFWFKPDWSSVSAGGTGPQTQGRLIEMGQQGTNTGRWTLLLDANGNTLSFVTQTNGVSMTNLTVTISWNSNVWHQVVLAYGISNSSIYLDGQPVLINGLGIAYYPALIVRTNGLTIGSSASGTNQAKGQFEDLETFNYLLIPQQIWTDYTNVSGKVLTSPVITTQPSSRTVVQGTNATFSVTATGASPLHYQWLFNGTNIIGATNTSLTLTNVQAINAGNYSVLVTNVAGSATSSNAVLTVIVPPIITQQPANQMVAQGSNATFSVTATGIGLTYQWQFFGTNISGATASTYTITNAQAATNGIYRVIVSNTAGSVTSSNAMLTVVIPPVIIMQPQPTNQTAVQGANLIYGVTATGTTPLSYQWYFNRTNAIAGATSSTFILAVSGPSAAGNYSVVVANWAGSVTSTAVSVAVVVPPIIIAQPTNQMLVQGSNTTFTVGVSANSTLPLGNQWYFNGTNLLTGATSTSLTLTNVQTTNAGNYSITVSNIAGMVTSSNALLTVVVPPSITLQPANQTAVQGANATFSVTVSGTTPLSYQWQFNGANISGATGNSYTEIDVQPGNVGNYSVVVTNWAGSVTSSNASLTVNLPPTIISQPTNQTFLQGSNVTFSVSAMGTTPLHYQWYFNGTNLLSGATNPSLILTNVQIVNAGNYSVIVTNIAGSVTSASASLTVNVPPTITSQPSSQTAIRGADVVFSVGVSNTSTIPLSYQWRLNGTNILGATGNSYTRFIVQSSDAGNYSVVISNVAGSMTSSDAVLMVVIPPSITIQPTNQIAPQGSNVTFSVSATSNAPLTYQWFLSRTNAVTGATNSSLTLTNVQLSQSGNCYDVTITNLAGSVTSSNAMLTVLVPPVITTPPASQTVVQGNNVTFNVAASGTLPMSYQWQFGGVNIFGATNNSYTRLVVQTSDAGTYSVIVTNLAGSVTTNANLIVNVLPWITTPPVSQTVAQGSNATFTVQASATPAPAYQWQFNGGNITGATNTNYTTTSAGIYDVVVSNAVGTATSVNATLTTVGVNRIISDGSSPEIQGAASIVLGSSIALRAMPNPNGIAFPSGFPIWANTSYPSGSSSLAVPSAGSMTGTFTPAAAGQYVIQASCGTSSTNFTITVADTNDANYDGINDSQELAYGTNTPQIQLGSWQFDTTNFAGLQNQLPLSNTNIAQVGGWSILAVEVNSNSGPAWLSYRETESNSVVANINLHSGTILFRFRSDWNSVGTNSGTGPGDNARLIEVGGRNTTNGCWGLYLEPNGTNVYFCTETNSATGTASIVQTNLTGIILWTSNDWHQIVLTYCPTNSSLYLDGNPLNTNGLGATNWPAESVRSQGFRIGSGITGTNWAQGRFDDLETYNYSWNSQSVSNYFKHHPQPHGTNTCLLAPIALYVSVATTLTNGQIATSTVGGGSGNFGWLSWDGDGSANYLIQALTNWTYCNTFTNADDNSDTTLSVGDWIHGNSGWQGSAEPSLTWLTNNAANGFGVVLWNNSKGTGSGTEYQAAQYAKIQLLGFQGGSAKTITYKYLGLTSCDSIVDKPPTNWIVSPTNSQIFNTPANIPATIPITVIASDPTSSVTNVAFYADSIYLGSAPFGVATNSDTNVVYNFFWTGPTNGVHTLTSMATDQLGLTNVSSGVPIIVNNPPTLSGRTNQTIVWPDYGTNVLLSVGSSDDGYPGGNLTNTWTRLSGPATVVFSNVVYLTNGSFGSTLTLSNNTIVSFSTNGTYVLQVTASDGAASVTSNCIITIKQRPFVYFTFPTNNALLNAGTNISLQAVAYDWDGYVSNVIFLNGTNFLGVVTPNGTNYSLSWTPATNGVYVLTVVATDNDGLTNNANVSFKVDGLPAVNAGPNQTSIWTEGITSTNVTLSGNVSVNGLLGLTNINWSVIASNGPVTFINTNTAGTVATFITNGVYTLQLEADDGFLTNTAVCQITILRRPFVSITLPSGNITNNLGSTIEVKAGAFDLDGNVANVTFFDGNGYTTNFNPVAGTTNYSLLWTPATNGIYYLTAVATDNDGLNTTSTPPVTVIVINPTPSVQITNPISQTYLARTRVPVQALASTPNGTVQWVHFFARTNNAVTNSLGYAIAPTNGYYQITWPPAVAGTYVLTAEVMDSRGSNAWSAPVTNIVRNLPVVTIISPTNGQVFLKSPTNLTIQVTAIPDSSTIITNVTFYQATNIIGVSTSGVANVFSIVWNGVTNGTYILSAEAFDANGGVSFSTNITITVETNQPPSVYAGPDQTINLTTNAMQLTGLVSDDGLPSNYLAIAWANISGPTNVSLAITNQAVTYVYFSATGVYQFRLSASDGQYTTCSTNTVTVLQPNLPPIVHAGTNQVLILPALANTNPIQTIKLTQISSVPFNGPKGLDYYSPSNCVIVSSGDTTNFTLTLENGDLIPFVEVDSANGDEAYITTVRNTLGGFKIGEMFAVNGNHPGEVLRIEPDGTLIGTAGTSHNAWLVLSNADGYVEQSDLRGGVWVDRTGVWGGDLIIASAGGNVWRVNSMGQSTLIARLTGGDTYEGITTIPNDAQKYGPWAGKILVGGDSSPIFAVDTNGFVVMYAFDFGAEDIRVIPENENFFGIGDGEPYLTGAPASEFQGMVGDILIASEFTGVLHRIHWDGSQFQTYTIAVGGSWEQVNFAPAGIDNVPVVNYVQLQGVVTDDGHLFSPSSNAWIQVSGPGPMTFDDSTLTNTLARFTVPGTYYLRLTAYDGQFNSYDETRVDVIRNQTPVVSAGTNQVISMTNAILSGFVTDDGWPSNQLNISWSLISGPNGGSVGGWDWSSEIVNSTNVTAANTVSFTMPGTYIFRLTADDGQAANSAEVTVTVQLPSLTLVPDYGWPTRTNDPYTVTARLMDENNNPITNAEIHFSFVNNSVNSINGGGYLPVTTDLNGYASFTYTNASSIIGRDTIQASANNCALVSVVKDWAEDLQCDSMVKHFPVYWGGSLSMDWPTNDPHYADYYLFNAAAGTPVTLSYTRPGGYPISEALVLRDPSNTVVAVSLNGQLNYTPVMSGDYLLEVAELIDSDSAPAYTPYYNLSLSCNGMPIQPLLPDLRVLYNGTNIINNNGFYDFEFICDPVIFPSTTSGVATNISLTISNAGANATQIIDIGIYDANNGYYSDGNFTINNNILYDTIAPSSSTNLSIGFIGSSIGLANSQLYFEVNSGDYYSINLFANVCSVGIVPPTIALVSPPDGTAFYYDSTYYGTIPFNIVPFNIAAMVTNGSASVNYVQWTIADSIYTSTASGNYYSTEGYLYGLGDYNITATAVDADGGTATAGPITVHVGTIPPEMQVLFNGTNVPNGGTVMLRQTTTNIPVSISLVITNPGAVALQIKDVETNNAFVNGNFSLLNDVSQTTTYFGNSTNLNVTYNAISNGVCVGALDLQAPGVANDNYVIYLVASAFPTGAPPTVVLLSPPNGSSYYAPATIAISAGASSSSTNISYVDFQQLTTNGTIDLGQVTIGVSNIYTLNSANLPAGDYTFTAAAVDAVGRSAAASPVTVHVLASNGNHPPVAVRDDVTVFAGSHNDIIYPLKNDYDPDGDPLTIIQVQPSTLTPSHPVHGIPTIINGGKAISYTPPPGQGYPIDGFSYEISDGRGGTAWGSVYVTAFATSTPQVTIISPPDRYSTNVGAIVPIVAQVTPSQYITNVEFYLGDVLIGSVANGANGFYTNFWTAASKDCDCGFTATAYDSFGQVGTSQPIHIGVAPPNNNPGGPSIGPVAAFSGYASGTNAMQPFVDRSFPPTNHMVTIRDGVFALSGQVYHPLGSNDMVWQLGVYSQDGQTLVRDLTPQMLVNGYHAGTVGSSISSGILVSNCDLTTLQNGVYVMRLTAIGGLMITNTDVQFILDSNLKIGQFSFSQQDVVIPVNGIPLTVTRTYNSLNPDKGDFGYGWTFAINSMDVSIDETRQDVEDFDGNVFSQRSGGGRDVTLTLPNGQRTTFYYYLRQGDFGRYYAEWQVSPNANSVQSFEAQGDNTLQTILGIAGEPPYWQAAGPGVPMDNFDFPGFILTMKDGTVYTISRESLGEHYMGGDTELSGEDDEQTYGQPYLSQISERSGDVITIDSSGITHISATNNIQRRVAFQRNSDGLITSITDPNGASSGPPAVKYEYDSYDNLMNVERLTDRTANGGNGAYVTNSFVYENPNFPHYITAMFNGDGTQVAKNFYDDSGKLIAVQDADGNLTQFIHNPANDMEVVVDRLGRTNTFVYDTRGNVTAQTNALGQVTAMAYDDSNNKTNEVVFLNGQPYATNSTIYNTYLNVPLVTTDPLGHTNSFSYDTYGNMLTSTDAKGNSTTNNYDANTGELVGTVDALGHGATNSYGGGLLIGSSDALGNITTNYYDPSTEYLTGTATLDASGNILSTNSFTYDDNGNRLTSTVWRRMNGSWTGATTTYIYDAMNRVTQTVDPDGGTNTVVYDLNGRQQATVDKLGRTTSYAYDAQGRLVQTIYPDQTTESSIYDASGNRVTSTDKAGRVTTYQYDALNRLTNTLYADGTTGATVYDGVGRAAQTLDARLTATAFAYDAAGRRLAVTNAVGLTVQTVSAYGYDANGNQLTFTDANNHTVTNVFDALNRQVEVDYPNNTKSATAYDAAGRRMAETNQDNLATWFGYDGAGRLTGVTNTLNQVTRYNYDEAGNEIAQIDALNRTNIYAYDNMGRRIKHTMPGNQVETFGYDLAGNLTRYTNYNGSIITNQYDVMNRLTNVLSVNGYHVSYTYTVTGQRATMTDASGVTTYSYDNRDRLVLKTVNWNGGSTVSLNYAYDANGEVTNIWSSTANGVNLIYNYDPLNRLTNVVGQASSLSQYGYDAVGNLQSMRYGNGVTNLYQYDALNRLTNSIWKLNASTLASFYYQVGLTGNRTNLNESVNGTSRTYSWQYDPLYRMTNENISAIGNVGYGYDAVGNRTNRTSSISGLANQTPTYNTNDWLNNDTYDSNGSTTVSGGNTYQYDVMNHLTNVNSGAILITYDGDGNRASKKVSGTTTYYLLDDKNPSGYVQVVEEYQGSSLNKVYNYGLSLISQRVPNTSTNYFIFDGHGSTRMLTDIVGNFVNAFAYDAYGTLIASNETPQTAYLYNCQQFDSDLNLIYLRARLDNPQTGRFLKMDSYEGDNEDPLSLHKYFYCQDDPVDMDDPSGNASSFTSAQAAAIGRQVHQIIGQDFTRNNSIVGRWTASTIFSIARIKNPVTKLGQKLGRIFPDLVDENTREVYEIKPVTIAGSAVGFAQLYAYVTALNKLLPPATWHDGNSYDFKGAFSLANPPCEVVVLPTVSGMIYYEAITIQQLGRSGAKTVAKSDSNDINQSLGVSTLITIL